MPVLSHDLERTVRRALAEAAKRRHAGATLEHLLLALTDSDEGGTLLDACAVDAARLRADLERHLDAAPAAPEAGEPAPPGELSRVMQRAAIHVQSAGRGLLHGGDVIVSMFSDRASPAVAILQAHGMARIDAVNFIAHGLRKDAPGVPLPATGAAVAGGEEAGTGRAFAELLRLLPRGVTLALGPGP